MPRILTQADVANFRSRLCDVAAQLFIEMGHDGFNMRELAKRLGVSAMTPYRYFKDKDEILAAVRTRAFAAFAACLEQASVGGQAALARAYARFALQEQAQYRLMFDISRPQNAVFPDLAQQEERVRAAMTASPHGGEAFDAGRAGHMLWSTLHGMVTLHLAGKLSSAEFERVLSEAIRIHGAGDTGDFQTLPESWTVSPREQGALSAAE